MICGVGDEVAAKPMVNSGTVVNVRMPGYGGGKTQTRRTLEAPVLRLPW